MISSLRRRIVVGTVFGTAVVLLTAGVALYAMMRASLLSEFDNALRAKAATLAAMIEQTGERIDLEFTEADMAEFVRTERPEYFQVWHTDGTVVERSPSLHQTDLPRIDDNERRTAIRAIGLPDGRSGRLVTLSVTARLDDEADPLLRPERLVFALARDVMDVNATLAQLLLVLLVVGVLAVAATLGVLTLLVRLGLRPVDRLAREIGGINERHLAMRINPASVPRELRPIVDRLNEGLERLDAAFTREKTITADVAHELRTPLAGLRSTLEVALSRERNPAAYREAMSDCLSITQQTQTLVENLLALARMDAQSEPIRREHTQIEALVRDAWKPFQGIACKKRLSVSWEIESNLTTETDREKFRLVLTNLFENATHYANNCGSVTIRGEKKNATLSICVANSGSQIPPEDVARVFDRFWRCDRARQNSGIHCGLGLALCHTIVERLGGAIRAQSEPGGFFAITISL